MSRDQTILLVEDSPQDVEMTLDALAPCRTTHSIVVAQDGAEALDYLYRRKKFRDRPEGNPLVVLLDLKMPKVDGLEVLKIVKSDENLRFVPIVILTSSREEQDVVKSYQLGVNAYVVKPVGFLQFVEAIKQIGVFWTLHNEPPPICCGSTP